MFSFKPIVRIVRINSVLKRFKYYSNKSVINEKSFSTYSTISNKLNVKTNSKAKHFLLNRELSSKPNLSANNNNIYLINENKKIIFIDNENRFAFKLIDSLLREENVEFSESVGNNCDSNEVFNQFMAIRSQDFREYLFVISDLIKAVKTLSFKQLATVLESMTEWPVSDLPFDPLFYKLWSNLDQELENRLKKTNFKDNKEVNPYLMFGNMFYRLRIANITKFNHLLVKKLSSHDFSLEKTPFLHLMFYINLHRVIDQKSIPFLMKTFDNLFNSLNLDEIGIICMTLFKTETKVTENLTKQIIAKTVSDMSVDTNNIIRAAITKCIRKSYHFHIQSHFREYVHKLKQLANNSEQTLTHLLILMYSAHIHDSHLMTQMLDKLFANPLVFRIKDIERILLCLSNFDQKLDVKKLESICSALDSNTDSFELYRYPICLLNILHYLTVLGIYPKPLIDHCFQPIFLDKILRSAKVDFQRHLLVVNSGLSIEKYEEFKHVLLPTEKVYRYHRWILTDEKSGLPNISKRGSLLNSVYMSLKSELHQRVQLCHILPFRSSPIVVLFNENNRSFSLNPKTELKQNMFKNCFAIYVLEINDFAVVDTMIRGSVRLEIRLLEGLGFKVLAIPWHQITCYNSPKAKTNKILKEIKKIDENFKLF